jgi:hypothetical protein
VRHKEETATAAVDFPPPSAFMPLSARPRLRVVVLPLLPLLLLFVLLSSSSSPLVCVLGETECVESGYVVSSLDARFCCPRNSFGLLYQLDVSSITINAAGTAAYCRGCYTTEATFNSCLPFAGGSFACCAGAWGQQWRQYTNTSYVCVFAPLSSRLTTVASC